MKDLQSKFFENGWANTPFFEVEIVIYDQECVKTKVFNTFGTDYFAGRHVLLTFFPSRALQLAAMTLRGGTTPVPRPPRLVSSSFESDATLYGR